MILLQPINNNKITIHYGEGNKKQGRINYNNMLHDDVLLLFICLLVDDYFFVGVSELVRLRSATTFKNEFFLIYNTNGE